MQCSAISSLPSAEDPATIGDYFFIRWMDLKRTSYRLDTADSNEEPKEITYNVPNVVLPHNRQLVYLNVGAYNRVTRHIIQWLEEGLQCAIDITQMNLLLPKF